VGVTRIESNRNRHFGLKIESKLIENRNLEIVTSLLRTTVRARTFLLNLSSSHQLIITAFDDTYCKNSLSAIKEFCNK